MILSNKDVISDIQKLAKIGYWVYDFTTDKFDYSKELLNLFIGEECGENVEINDFLNIVHEGDRERVISLVFENKKAKVLKYNFQFRIKSTCQEYKYVRFDVFTKLNKGGDVTFLQGIVQDITELYKSQLELKINQERIDFAINAVGMGIWELSSNKKDLFWSDEAYCIFGYEPHTSSMNPEIVISHIFKSDQENLEAYFKSLRDGQVHSFTYRILSNDGRVKHIKDTAYCKKDEDGNIVNYVGYIQDITEQKLKEIKIVDRLEHLKFVAELAKLGYWEYFVDTQKLLVHELYSDSLDKKALGRNPSINDFLKLLEKDEKQKVITTVRTMSKTGEDTELIICLKKASGDVWLLIKGTCYYSNNHLLKIYGCIQDITERYFINKNLVLAK
jgi:PAS domain S-box-containing protein